jgi:hypothetical protein
MFLTFEPGLIGTAGCTLTVVVEAGEARSEPLTAGRLVRLPRIERLELTDDRLAGGNYAGLLRGWNLETIAKVGWDASNGAAVEQPPLPMAGERGKQELRTGIPWPSPTPRARLFVWLRGDSAGRATSTRP